MLITLIRRCILESNSKVEWFCLGLIQDINCGLWPSKILEHNYKTIQLFEDSHNA